MIHIYREREDAEMECMYIYTEKREEEEIEGVYVYSTYMQREGEDINYTGVMEKDAEGCRDEV